MSDRTQPPAIAAGERAADLVLRVAHIVVTVAAAACFLGVIVVGFVALGYAAGAAGSAPQVTIPPPYSPAPAAIDTAQIARTMLPPGKIAFVLTASPLNANFSEDTVLGHLVAHAPGGMPPFPLAFRIVGGSGAAYVEITPEGVIATADLVSRIARTLARKPRPAVFQFTLVVLATNRFSIASHDTITVSLPLSLASTAPSVPAPAAAPVKPPAKAAPAPLTRLQSIARTYAKAVDPDHTPEFFLAYQAAHSLPSRCNANGVPSFLDGFQRALNEEQGQLNARSGPAFLNLVCRSWNMSILRQTTLVDRSNFVRQQAFARQNALDAQAQAARAVARVKRNAALLALAAVIGAFVVIALLLAFLAIERHTRMLGAMVQRLAAQATVEGLPSAAPPGSAQP